MPHLATPDGGSSPAQAALAYDLDRGTAQPDASVAFDPVPIAAADRPSVIATPAASAPFVVDGWHGSPGS